MSRLATLLINIVDAIRAFFTRAAPPDPHAPPSASPGAGPGPRPISPTVRAFILDGHPPQERATLERQIRDYEATGQTSFTLQYPGGYYLVKDGQVVGAFILDGHPPQERATLERQIRDYEATGQTSFTLQYPGGYYLILEEQEGNDGKDGQVVGSGRGE